MIEYFSTIDHQVALMANVLSICAAWLFTKKHDCGVWFGLVAEIFWLLWINETGKWEILPVELLAFIIYLYGCITQMRGQKVWMKY